MWCHVIRVSHVFHVNKYVNKFLLHGKLCYVVKTCKQICLHMTHMYAIRSLIQKSILDKLCSLDIPKYQMNATE